MIKRKISLLLAIVMIISLCGCGLVELEYSAEENITTAVSEEYVTDDNTSYSEGHIDYNFRSDYYLDQHYDKHGKEMGFASPEEYEEAACEVINNPEALHKFEAEDNDEVFYIEATNEFVVLSTDGYIRTYFEPSAGIDYFNRQ